MQRIILLCLALLTGCTYSGKHYTWLDTGPESETMPWLQSQETAKLCDLLPVSASYKLPVMQQRIAHVLVQRGYTERECTPEGQECLKRGLNPGNREAYNTCFMEQRMVSQLRKKVQAQEDANNEVTIVKEHRHHTSSCTTTWYLAPFLCD